MGSGLTFDTRELWGQALHLTRTAMGSGLTFDTRAESRDLVLHLTPEKFEASNKSLLLRIRYDGPSTTD
ncbi:MAG: hypothetical protein ACJAWL_002593 [Motiliproteus sp.]|jgi:hypothetical protein